MTERSVLLAVTPHEFDTMLAALRFWEARGDDAPQEIIDIATNGGDHESMSLDAIDELCQDLNTGGRKPAIVEAAEGALTLMREFHEHCEEREYTDVGDHWTNTGQVFEALYFGLKGELILEESIRTDGVYMQTVRLSDGTETVREKPVIEGGF